MGACGVTTSGNGKRAGADTPRSKMHPRLADKLKTAMRVVGIAGIAVIVIAIAYKGAADITALAQKHSGGEFWMALVRYFFKNMAGGAG
jgi:hypothetical protein